LLNHWRAYTETAGAMFATTHTLVAEWVVANTNDKRSAQINANMCVLHALPCDGQDLEVAAPPDPAMVAPLDEAERSRPRVHAAEPR
jgi:hypothetical protein